MAESEETPLWEDDNSSGSDAEQDENSIRIDASTVVSSYANYCRISSTPEEMILDLGFNADPFAQGGNSVKLTQRIIVNHYTAKRLFGALSVVIQRHEETFGVLETDVGKRVQSS